MEQRGRRGGEGRGRGRGDNEVPFALPITSLCAYVVRSLRYLSHFPIAAVLCTQQSMQAGSPPSLILAPSLSITVPMHLAIRVPK